MIGFVHPAQMMAAVGSMRVIPDVGAIDEAEEGRSAGVPLFNSGSCFGSTSAVSQEETAITGRPAKAIPILGVLGVGTLSSSLLPIEIVGRGVNTAG